MSLTIGSLFSGTGGLDLAVESVTGAQPAWFVEFDPAPSKILAHHWPQVPNYGDVTQVRWEDMPPVDIITGGYPCQPFSAAGQRKGTNDDRHLWPHVREAIRILRPRYALLENVAGHRSLGFDQVLADCAQDGLHVRWTSLRASDIGAPHHRERIFILVSPDPDSLGLEAKRSPSRSNEEISWDHDSYESLAGIGRAADIGREIRLRWGDFAAGRVMVWAMLHGYPPPIVEEQVTYHDEGIWGRAFPEVKATLNPEFASWMMGLPAGWITDVPGLSRADQLKAAGNGVVPQQAAAALNQLLAMTGGQEGRVAA